MAYLNGHSEIALVGSPAPGEALAVADNSPTRALPERSNVGCIVQPAVRRRRANDGSDQARLRRSTFRSWSTIIRIISSKVTVGRHPSTSLALLASPTSESTSAGRSKVSSSTT